MKWASALSEAQETGRAIRDAAGEVGRQLGGSEPDLVVAFVSPHHADAYESLPADTRPYGVATDPARAYVPVYGLYLAARVALPYGPHAV